MIEKLVCVSLCLVTMLFAAVLSVAQTPSIPQVAPPPAQLFAARKIFLSNASGETLSGTAASDLTYNAFYMDLKAWGRYDLASTPLDADLVFEIRYETPPGPTNGGSSWGFPQVRLSIFDPKTHVVLWAFTELMVSTQHESDQQHLRETLTNVLNDLKKLVAQGPAGTAPAAMTLSNSPTG
jgi:hypothetical protein